MKERKLSCLLTLVDAEFEPFGSLEGVLHLFTHDYADCLFWHGAVEVVDGMELIEAAFDMGQEQDIRILLNAEELTGMAKLVFIATQHASGLDHHVVGITGISTLTEHDPDA